jgi:predicted dehydrogenase
METGIVATSLDELLTDDRVDVIDIGITPHAQLEVAERAIRAGKHLLCQKPLAPTLAQAVRLVELAESHGVKLAVNQQMRWEPIVACVKHALDDGTLGEPTAALIETNMRDDFPAEHWLAREPRLMALYGTIHFLDSARFLFGEPEWVTAHISRDPLQTSQGETWINAWLEWSSGFSLVIFERYTNWAGDLTATMRVEGTRGAVRGHFGLWDDYPHRRPDVVERIAYANGEWTEISSDAAWLPDAFAGPMVGLLEALDADRDPPTSGRDNLLTLRLVEAVYRSSLERRAVRPQDIAVL